MEISPLIRESAPLILSEIKKATSMLLHCHPSPDPDSVGSALAMKFALEQMGKKVTVIKGDSDIPAAFMHFPGATEIVQKNFFEIDLKAFDLFIAQDSGSIEMVSRKAPVVFPDTLRVIVIDHHRTNSKYGSINLVDPSYPAVGQMLYDLFNIWGIRIDENIASNLFIGIYTDTGGFKYEGTTRNTFLAAGDLIGHVPNWNSIIARMENSNTPEFLRYQGFALSNIKSFAEGSFALSIVPHNTMVQLNISETPMGAGYISSILRSVGQWKIVGALIETEPNVVKVSFRTNDAHTYDVSLLAVALGGGGHKAAAGAVLNVPLAEAEQIVVSKIKELYNL